MFTTIMKALPRKEEAIQERKIREVVEIDLGNGKEVKKITMTNIDGNYL